MVKTHQFGPLAFNGFIEELFNGNNPKFFRDAPVHDTHHVPVNIKEQDANFNIEVIAPGVAKEDFSIQVNDKVLSISFEQKEEEDKEEGKWLRKEYKVRSFKRNFTLGEKVDAEKISANHNNGILTLTLPKKEAAIATNRTIDIL
ncbi:Hsp20/alpha crystallin family protein [Taibaiella lutea]|uniref:Hsp20/alpha crystallin family protein n=1 Tax=Taibaiella lutea TaxID=2608001 RepID=UPI001C0FFA51|nr:Hsp20/alpha crystallin family protein [Taibaiella lutea]